MGLNTLDWTIVAIYLALVFAIGFRVARQRGGDRSFFLADRSFPVWAVALSVVATNLSAATYISTAEVSFRGNLTLLLLPIATTAAARTRYNGSSRRNPLVPRYVHSSSPACSPFPSSSSFSSSGSSSTSSTRGRIFSAASRPTIRSVIRSYDRRRRRGSVVQWFPGAPGFSGEGVQLKTVFDLI
jgi:hypothetical protein